jgi:hypothetical protein
VKQQNNDKVIQDITEWIKRDATENPHSEIKLSLHVHGGRVAKIEYGTIAKLNLEKRPIRGVAG